MIRSRTSIDTNAPNIIYNLHSTVHDYPIRIDTYGTILLVTTIATSIEFTAMHKEQHVM